VELRARRAAALAAVLLGSLLAAAAPASAQDLRFPPAKDEPPPGYRLTAEQATRIADRDARVVEERREGGRELTSTAYLKDPGQWQVSYFSEPGRVERAQVTIDDATGAVLESWTGPQVAWKMARGYEGAFARKLNAPYVWLPLCLLFLAPFVDRRRPFRLLHLDLLALLAFGASHIFFNRGEISTSVPLAYPVLGYLLLRLLWEGFRPRRGRGPLVPHASVTWLALALVFLVGFRVALNIADSNVIDVGYAGAIGADRIVHGEALYEGGFPDDNEHGDTYGAANYLVYVPFELALPWSGEWDDVPAAHAAAIAFDLLTLLGLLVLGRRLRAGPAGTALGVALAYAWAAYPYTLFALNSNANDTLVAAVLVWALVVLRSAPLRGALVAVGAAAKFVPLALAPLFAAGQGPLRARGAIVFSLALAAVIAASFAPFVPDGGLRELYDRTLGYQVGRDSPFSVWGQHESLAPLWTAVKAGAVGLGLLVAFVPRRRTPVQVAALGAAVLVALQLAAAHWFYLYVVWFAPFALVAFFARHEEEAPGPDAEATAAEETAAESRQPAVA
jgi:Glycosyltransferase family 87